MANPIELQIVGVEASIAGKYAMELQRELEQADPTLQVGPGANDPSHMDFGATLVLVLGTPVAIAVARGIQAWLARRGTRAVIKSGGKEIELTNMKSEDIAAALKAAGGL